MAKSRCMCCKSLKGLKLTCKFCDMNYCTFCLMPEKHKCIKLDDCESIAKQRLDIELYKNKCIGSKVKMI
jgi:hypothetical protein